MTANRGSVTLPTGSFIEAINESCTATRLKANIAIHPEAIKRVLFSPAFTTSFKRVSALHGLRFPLNFPSLASELNLLSILSLLNFGSGYRVPLRAQTGRGAWDNIRALVFGLFLSSATGGGDLMSARGMQDITEQRVADLMNVNIHVERAHSVGITIGELGGPIYELVKFVSATLRETGKILQNNGYPDLGTFVLESLKEGRSAQDASSGKGDLDIVLEKIVRALPAFQDMAVVDGQPVYCFKKALFLIHAVAIRFGFPSNPLIPVPDTSRIPVFSDNVLPSLLIHLGVIDLSGASHGLSSIFLDAGSSGRLASLLAEASDKTPEEQGRVDPLEGPVLTETQAFILRAAAVDACRLIVEFARSLDSLSLTSDLKWVKDISLPDLDMWLWAVAKDRRDYRQLERFVLRDTVFF